METMLFTQRTTKLLKTISQKTMIKYQQALVFEKSIWYLAGGLGSPSWDDHTSNLALTWVTAIDQFLHGIKQQNVIIVMERKTGETSTKLFQKLWIAIVWHAVVATPPVVLR